MFEFQLSSLILLTTCVLFSSSSAFEPEINSLRLPTNTAPRLYTIQLDPQIDNENFTFDGTSSVTFEVLEPTNVITVHTSALIDIDKNYTSIIDSNGVKEKPASQEWNPNLELFNMKFNKMLRKGGYTIEFKWKGVESTDYTQTVKQGFFRRRLDDGRYVAATQLKPRGARSVFPCWDEPSYKADFKISIKHYPNYTAISNMPMQKTTTTDDGKIWTSFEKTPPMSSHVINFVVGPYSKVSNEHGNVTLWTLSTELQQMSFIQKLSPLMVQELERYTGISYPLPTLNSIYVPKYPKSANDHFGVNIYSDSILFDPEASPGVLKQFTRVAVAQPIAHQWFGNLVTHSWWNDAWLSETLSMYLGCKLLNNVLNETTGNEPYMFESSIMARVLYLAERTSGKDRQIISMPQNLDEIDRSVVSVNRFKGMSIIQMLEHILSEEVFKNGLRKYLIKHKFGSVTTDDLWTSLQEALDEEPRASSNIPANYAIKTIMDPWLKQTGCPLLNVTRDYKTGVTTITQSAIADSKSTHLWSIPVTYATSSKPDFSNTDITHWLHAGDEGLKLHGIPKDDWIILNLQMKDFYRVSYDTENWKRITAQLNSDNYHRIHVLNRVQIINDITKFSYEEEHDVEIILDVLSYLRRETNVLPWLIADEVLTTLTYRLINSPVYGLFKKFVLNLLKKITEHLDSAEHNPDDLSGLFRHEMMYMACQYGDHKCKDKATAKLMEVVSNKNRKPISVDDKGWVYCAGLSTADETVWESVMKAHHDNPKKNPDVYEYLGCTKNQVIIKKYLTLALNTLPSNDSAWSKDVISSACQSLKSQSAEQYSFAIDFFAENADKLRQYYNMRNKPDGFAGIIRCLTFSPKTTEHQIKLKKLINAQRGTLENPETSISEINEVVNDYIRMNDLFSAVLKRKARFYNI